MIDYQAKCKRGVGRNNKKTSRRSTWQDARPLSAMHQGPRTEAVARLLERKALTASPKASVNLYRQNGVGDVWQISHCLSSHFGRRLRRGLVLGETGEKTRQARRSFTSQAKWAFFLSEAGAWFRGLNFSGKYGVILQGFRFWHCLMGGKMLDFFFFFFQSWSEKLNSGGSSQPWSGLWSKGDSLLHIKLR